MSFFLWTLMAFLSCGRSHSEHMSVVTHLNESQIERGLLFFRSLWEYNAKKTVNGDLMFAHVCVHGADSIRLKKYSQRYAKVGAVVHDAHDTTPHHQLKNLTGQQVSDWRNLLCTAQVADYYFMNNILQMKVLFLDISYIIVNDLRKTLVKNLSLYSSLIPENPIIFCMPCLVGVNQFDDIGALCDMNILLIPTQIGTEFYSVLNATKPRNLYASEAFEAAARSISEGIAFLQTASATSHGRDMVIRDGRIWTGKINDPSGVALVEFGGSFNKIKISGCEVFVDLQWTNHFNTAEILSVIFSRDLVYLQQICDDTPLFSPDEDLDGFRSLKETSGSNPAVFDLIIFNDEIELLLLRLEYLKHHVTKHVIIESPTTFTGKPKPLHFLNNKHLFDDYNISSFVLPMEEALGTLPDDLVWQREYASRNSLYDALVSLNAFDDDIILVCDVDEIPHLKAIERLVAIHSNSNDHITTGRVIHGSGYRRRIHKLHQRTFMYDFNCALEKSGKTLSFTALTATTLGYAKELFNERSLMTSVRKYRQSLSPYPYEEVLEPGGWHLTFFGGVDKIRSKLDSYSHQNIRRTFVEEDELTSSLMRKISEGKQIDDREEEKCAKQQLDEDTMQVKELWDAILQISQTASGDNN